ncbi:MAG: hypothetical protein H6R37_1521, partial [Deltaproteobacteria bacterium]|nr:hypothetical protein [Deltaproteobacteria bacterium]
CLAEVVTKAEAFGEGGCHAIV